MALSLSMTLLRTCKFPCSEEQNYNCVLSSQSQTKYFINSRNANKIYWNGQIRILYFPICILTCEDGGVAKKATSE